VSPSAPSSTINPSTERLFVFVATSSLALASACGVGSSLYFWSSKKMLGSVD
jgi:hypothetical protein